MILNHVINVDVQLVSYILIYSSMGIFGKLFNWVFVSSCLLGVLFCFMLMILDNGIIVDLQFVSYVFIYLSIVNYLIECLFQVIY